MCVCVVCSRARCVCVYDNVCDRAQERERERENIFIVLLSAHLMGLGFRI
jgi:hypothetical protein